MAATMRSSSPLPQGGGKKRVSAPHSHPAASGRKAEHRLIYVNVSVPLALTLRAAASETARACTCSAGTQREVPMHSRKRLSIKSATVAGIAASALLGLAGVTLNPAPAKAVVYCTYEGYPGGCVARAGVVLRPRPVARAAVRHNAGGNMNGGVNRVGARR